MIGTCNCKHEYQDKIYGIGHRVFNPMKLTGKYRCTVCGNIITAGKVIEEEKKVVKNK